MRFYSEKRVKRIIFNTLEATVKGYMKFVEKETDAVHKDTKEVYHDAVIELRENPRNPTEYIHKELEEYGIFITPKFLGHHHIQIKPVKSNLGFFEKWAYKILKKKIDQDLGDLSWHLGVEKLNDTKLIEAYDQVSKLKESFTEYFKR